MKNEGSEEPVHEIVLIRRRGDSDHDDAHGGVWKVAFADFMTAMMAFFLVLWIVNSTSKETRVTVARYFNPVKLQEATPVKRGMDDPKESFSEGEADEKHQKEGASKEKSAPSSKPDSRGHSAEQKDAGKPAPRQSDARAGFRDPFAHEASESKASSDESDAASEAAGPTNTSSGGAASAKDAAEIRAELAKSLGQEFEKLGAALAVSVEGDGVLISLTDSADFGMFAVGSAVPEPRLSRTLAAIATALKSRPGGLVIRGHTDARPYRAGGADNWQLSASRAQAARSALIAAGVDDARIERIEGYADHKLKSPNAPEAAENRRIEILLRGKRA
ncbi:MAG: OmpA family protein [Hyphomicrobiales bacterium]|nr:OmpA family protein [Hyphomicrobiales bacterium]